MMTEDNYDEINRLLKEISEQSFEFSEDLNRLYIASGEDFNIDSTKGSPNQLWGK